MAIDFPDSPTNDQIFTSGSRSWQYNATKGIWTSVASSGGSGDAGGVTVYANTDVLPYVGNSNGDQAFVLSNNRLYIWNNSGWYNVALINNAPNITSVVDSANNSSPISLETDGSNTVITVNATDEDGDPISFSANGDTDFAGLATVTQSSNNVFTITPLSTPSTGDGLVTFKATDGVNISSSVVQFVSGDIIASTVTSADGGYYFDHTNTAKFNSGGVINDGTSITTIDAITPSTTSTQADSNAVTWDATEVSLLKSSTGSGYYTIPRSDVEGTATTVGDHIFGVVMKSNGASSGQARIARFVYSDGSRFQWGMNNSGTDCWASSRPDGEAFSSQIFNTNLNGGDFYGIIWEYINSTRTWTVHVVDNTGNKTSYNQESGGPTNDLFPAGEEVTIFGTYNTGSYEQVGDYRVHFLALGSHTSQEISDLLDGMYTNYIESNPA